jgi:hypothetical protein
MPTVPCETCLGPARRKVPHFLYFFTIVLLATFVAEAASYDAATDPHVIPGIVQATEESSTSRGVTVIFEQPRLNGVVGHFHVPTAEHKYPSDQPFNVLLWQPNPNTSDGQLVPSTWSAGDKTGFYPDSPLGEYQEAFKNAHGASTVQIDGGTIGAYITSEDLPNGTDRSKMMITPAYVFPKSAPIYPFARGDVALVNSFELQVPVARDLNQPGNMTYVSPYFYLQDSRSHTLISYGITVFHHSSRPGPAPSPDWLRKTEVGPFDDPTHSYQVGNALGLGSRVVSVLSGTTLYQNQPWKGWRLFNFAITRSNFESALQALKNKDPTFPGSENPSDYVLIEWHLNAELNFAHGPAELGWSMRLARVSLVPNSQLTALGDTK